MKSVYIAGPLFTEGERYFLEKVESVCTQNGLKTYLPHRDVNQKLNSKIVFEHDLKLLNDIDLVIAVLDGPDIDSGTAFEIGYCFANNKPIIGIRTDYRAMAFLNRENPLASEVNLMIRYALKEYCRNLNDLNNFLQNYNNKQ